jgi:hypothetical protein
MELLGRDVGTTRFEVTKDTIEFVEVVRVAAETTAPSVTLKRVNSAVIPEVAKPRTMKVMPLVVLPCEVGKEAGLNRMLPAETLEVEFVACVPDTAGRS